MRKIDIYEVTYRDPAEGELHRELVEEWKLERWLGTNCDCDVISIEPSEGTQERIQAEIEAYRRGDENAFGDVCRW